MGKTSYEVKDRWNRKHYDQILIRVGAGSKSAVKEIARARGLSVSAYIKMLIIRDCKACGNADISALLGGEG